MIFVGFFSSSFLRGFGQICWIFVIGMAGERKMGFINKRNLHQSLSTLPHQYFEVQVRGRMLVIITEILFVSHTLMGLGVPGSRMI